MDLPWLLAAARCAESASMPVAGVTAQIVEHLRERGANFASDIAQATRQLPEQVERALWDGVARGMVMCDGFAAIRSLLKVGTHPAQRTWGFSQLRRVAQLSTSLSAAAEQLARIRKSPPCEQRVVVNATDPLNLIGVILPGETVAAVRTNTVA